mmetsp:Transcript_9153/g.23941  ORF Transcript_9153/g.23941 Transcript_9153/m.23941 type:complete len:203 (+) Transcript_9153:188-796(+)
MSPYSYRLREEHAVRKTHGHQRARACQTPKLPEDLAWLVQVIHRHNVDDGIERRVVVWELRFPIEVFRQEVGELFVFPQLFNVHSHADDAAGREACREMGYPTRANVQDRDVATGQIVKVPFPDALDRVVVDVLHQPWLPVKDCVVGFVLSAHVGLAPGPARWVSDVLEGIDARWQFPSLNERRLPQKVVCTEEFSPRRRWN